MTPLSLTEEALLTEDKVKEEKKKQPACAGSSASADGNARKQRE